MQKQEKLSTKPQLSIKEELTKTSLEPEIKPRSETKQSVIGKHNE